MRHNPVGTVNIFVSKPCPECGRLVQAGWCYYPELPGAPKEMVMRHESPECTWYRRSDAGMVLKALRGAGWQGTKKKKKSRRQRRLV